MSNVIDITAKLESLRQTVEKGRERRLQSTDAEKAGKAAAWARIQTEAPDHADFLRAISSAFGKPAMVRITINGERLL